MITNDNLHPNRYFISGWTFNEHTNLYLEKKGNGWYVHAGEMYLAATDMGIKDYTERAPSFFYKNGEVFENKERALEVLNLAIQKYKEQNDNRASSET